MKLLIIGISSNHGLEKSYYRAALNCGFDTHFIDYQYIMSKYIKGWRIGKLINLFLPIEQWTRKMNREIIIILKEITPDVVLIVGNAKILYGTLMTLKTMNSQQKLVWIWPDTPLNMELNSVSNGLLVDLFATYSSFSIPVFQKLNFSNVKWLPLGFDESLYLCGPDSGDYSVDIGFVGGWRPERELVLEYIIRNFPELVIEIHGPYWHRNCKSNIVKEKVKSGGIFDSETASYFANTRINLNVIDDTNYPAANMRFFEISGTGAVQICSTCLEMCEIYRDFESCLFYDDLEELKSKIKWVIENESKAKAIGLKAKEITLDKNTYKERLLQIFDFLNLKL
jgi:hypothetical protein